MKKQGSILIEVIAAIMILMMTITFIVNTAVQSKNMLKKRILQEEVSRTVCNLMNEFKYNITKEEIEKMLSEENNLIGFRYSTDLSEQLVNTDIKELAHGNDIEVSKLAESNMGLRLKIVAKIYSNKNEVIVEKEFTKSWWMDET
jgi:type II secretory pathway pseudopilin PulG